MQNCKHEFIIDKVGLYTIFPLVMRLTSLKTAFCVQPISSKFLMLKSILYTTHVFLNMFEIFSLLQSNNKYLMFSLTLHKLQRPFSCFFIRRSLSFRFTFPNLNLEISTSFLLSISAKLILVFTSGQMH